jgi:LPXTG-site transpeptidase (sortase) family protein
VGWLEGTAYPTREGNTVLTAHGYTADGNAGPFSLLKDLKYGETIVIHLGGMKYTYAVRTNFTISPNNTYWLTRHEKLDWITLITCQQYDEKTKSYRFRRVVRAVLVSVEEE